MLKKQKPQTLSCTAKTLKVGVGEPLGVLRPDDRCVCVCVDRGRETTAVGLLGADVGDLCKLLIAAGSHYI